MSKSDVITCDRLRDDPGQHPVFTSELELADHVGGGGGGLGTPFEALTKLLNGFGRVRPDLASEFHCPKVYIPIRFAKISPSNASCNPSLLALICPYRHQLA